MTESTFQKRRVKLLCAPHGQKRRAARKIIRLRYRMLVRELAR